MMLTSDGQVYATGAGLYYRTGLNSTADVQKFTRCTGAIQSYTITRIAVHLDGSFALDSTGNVWACGLGTWNGLVSTAYAQEFTKITEPAEFYSRTIVNIKSGYSTSVYALDSEGVLWGMGNAIRGVGSTSVNDASSFALFTKISLTNMPRAFNYTPTLTLENPNADYGATVEFKNPNNRAFINLDDQTSNLRLGFVNNENNAGIFRGLSIGPYGAYNIPAVAYKNRPNQGASNWTETISTGHVDFNQTFCNSQTVTIKGTDIKCLAKGLYRATIVTAVGAQGTKTTHYGVNMDNTDYKLAITGYHQVSYTETTAKKSTTELIFYVNNAKSVNIEIQPNSNGTAEVQWEGYSTSAVAQVEVYYLGDVDVINFNG